MSQRTARGNDALIDCSEKGFTLLEKYISPYEVERFFAMPLVPAVANKSTLDNEYLCSNRPDIFYTYLSVRYATDDLLQVKQIIGGQDIRANFLAAIDFIEHALYQESKFERDLSHSVYSYTSCEDDEIRKAFLARFDVSEVNMLDLPTDRSVYFAKVNHGLWEFIRGAYDERRTGHRERFREIDERYMLREARTSGISQLWGRLIYRYLHPVSMTLPKGHTSFCISLTAGSEPPAQSIDKDLTPVVRGAAIGLLSMFEISGLGIERCRQGDGGATRLLIQKGGLEEFFERYISDTEACVFFVPPHLQHIGFLNYKGDVYKFLVPPRKINNAWKTVIATFMGYLQRLSERYGSITVLAQGASIASAVGLLLAEMESEFPGVRLRFFDLGRILDVTAPDVLQKQAWAVRHHQELIDEGAKIFRNAGSHDWVLASPI